MLYRGACACPVHTLHCKRGLGPLGRARAENTFHAVQCPNSAPHPPKFGALQALESAFSAAGHLVRHSPPDAACDALAGLATQALQVLQDGDLPGQVQAAGRGLAAVLDAAPRTGSRASSPHATASSHDAAEEDQDSASCIGNLNALRRGVAATLGQLIEPAARDAKADGAEDAVSAARREAVISAVLAVGAACGESPAAANEGPVDDEAAANGNGHVANGIQPSGRDSRLLCLQVSTLDAQRSVLAQEPYTSLPAEG